MTKAICNTNQDLKDDLILGHLFFYTLGKMKITEVELKSLFRKNNIPISRLKKISKVDAFRRATSSFKSKIHVSPSTKVYKASLDIDEVNCDANGITRIIGRKIIDSKNKTLKYDIIGNVSYLRNNKEMIVKIDENYNNEYNYDVLKLQMLNRYKEWSNYHTKDTIRNIILGILKNMYPVNLLPTGLCKFIPKYYKNELYNLKCLINDLSQYGEGNVFEIIPIVDTIEERNLVFKSANREITDDLSSFLDNIDNAMINKENLSTKTVASYTTKFKGLLEKANKYETLIDKNMVDAKAKIVEAINYVTNK